MTTEQTTYGTYWNMVLGANRNAARVVDEIGLTETGPALDEWLGQAEAAAVAEIRVDGRPLSHDQRTDLYDEWIGFHGRALAELTEAIEAEAPTVHFCDELGGPSAEGVVGTGTTPCGEPLSGVLGVRWSRDMAAVTCPTCRRAVGRS